MLVVMHVNHGQNAVAPLFGCLIRIHAERRNGSRLRVRRSVVAQPVAFGRPSVDWGVSNPDRQFRRQLAQPFAELRINNDSHDILRLGPLRRRLFHRSNY